MRNKQLLEYVGKIVEYRTIWDTFYIGKLIELDRYFATFEYNGNETSIKIFNIAQIRLYKKG